MKLFILMFAVAALAAACDRETTSRGAGSEGKAAQSAAGGSADEGKAARSAGR
jgi:hypothetical protein